MCRLDNKLRAWTGSVPNDATVADRAYNTRSLINAQLGYDAVASVQYDAREAPDRWGRGGVVIKVRARQAQWCVQHADIMCSPVLLPVKHALPPDHWCTPCRETVSFNTIGPDMRPLPPRRAELYINRT
jgi:hypothetical protein